MALKVEAPDRKVALHLVGRTIDFDLVFKAKYPQELLFDSESETLTFRAWHERLRGLPREERLKVQQVLREREDLFERIHAAMKGSVVQKPEPHAFAPLMPPRLIAEATWYLDNFFATSLKYLGPLRDAPKPLYPLAPAADPHDVGLRGEHTASILELHKNKKIWYIPSANFKAPVIDRKTVTRTLETAVIDWLQYLGVASSVKSRDQGKLGHELKVGLSNSYSTHYGNKLILIGNVDINLFFGPNLNLIRADVKRSYEQGGTSGYMISVLQQHLPWD